MQYCMLIPKGTLPRLFLNAGPSWLTPGLVCHNVGTVPYTVEYNKQRIVILKLANWFSRNGL